jgi:uncharacterized membrane protein
MLTMVGAWVIAAAWIVKSSPAPFIDVHVFQRDGTEAFLRGENPWAITFPNIYGHDQYYGPGIVRDGRLMFGFPYPPLVLLAGVLGKIVFGDYRYAHVVAMAVGATLLYLARPGRLSAAAAAVLLLFPRVFLVVEQGWTEPFVIATFGLTILCAVRAPKLMPYALGLFLTTKQYCLLAAPAALLLVHPFRWRDALTMYAKAAVTGAVVIAPFFLWNPKAFWWSVAELQVYQPFRDDALSMLVWYKKATGVQPSVGLAFVAAMVGAALGLWRLPRTPAGFAGCVAATFYGFIAFNKQAFCNYYFFVCAALTVAFGATSMSKSRAAP